MAKYTGKDMVVTFAGVDISGQGRNLEVSEEADEVNVTTYGSDDKEFIPGMTERDATMEVLDDASSATIRQTVGIGSAGTLRWQPLGTAAGKPRFTVGTAFVRSRSLSYPYDDAVLMNCTLRLSGAVSEDVNA